MVVTDGMMRSKNILIFMFVIYLLLDLVIVILSQDLPKMIRPILTFGLFYFVLSGKIWAYWINIVLFALGVLLGIAGFLYFLTQNQIAIAMVLVILILLTLPIPCFLLFNDNIKQYLAFKRKISSTR